MLISTRMRTTKKRSCLNQLNSERKRNRRYQSLTWMRQWYQPALVVDSRQLSRHTSSSNFKISLSMCESDPTSRTAQNVCHSSMRQWYSPQVSRNMQIRSQIIQTQSVRSLSEDSTAKIASRSKKVSLSRTQMSSSIERKITSSLQTTR